MKKVIMVLVLILIGSNAGAGIFDIFKYDKKEIDTMQQGLVNNKKHIEKLEKNIDVKVSALSDNMISLRNDMRLEMTTKISAAVQAKLQIGSSDSSKTAGGDIITKNSEKIFLYLTASSLILNVLFLVLIAYLVVTIIAKNKWIVNLLVSIKTKRAEIGVLRNGGKKNES